MFPELFHLGWFSVHTYGLMAATAMLVGLFVAVKLARRYGVDPDKAWTLGIIVIFSALLGAKILYVINNWSVYAASPRRLFSLEFLQLGGVFYGGLLAAIIAGVWYLRHANLPALKTMDVFAPGIALGHTFGRLGCFAAGCCYGRPTDVPWGVVFTNPIAAATGVQLNVHLHPTQLYELVVELANFIILMWLLPRKKFDGQVMGAYLFLYGFARYFIEFFRGEPDRAMVFGGFMTLTQLVSILLVIAGGALWIRKPAARSAGTPLAEAAH
jgi:phosphatidylglycerol---prolipoprotein diacylglyceryl transferase